MASVMQAAGAAEEPVTFRPLSRIAVRAIAEFIVHISATITASFDGDTDIGFVFVHLLRRADLDGGGALPATSINAISRASARPFETVRRQCNRLCEMGLVEKTEAGPIVSMQGLADPRAMRIRTTLHDNLVRLVADLGRLDFPLPPRQPGAVAERAAIERAAMDLMLYTFEYGVPPHPIPNWQKPLLYLFVMTANARAYTFDPMLARLHADVTTPPPDALRTPISASALARAMALPYSTVRRNLEELIEIGQLLRVDQGYLIDMRWMQSTSSAASGVAMAVQLERVLRGLAGIGFPMNAPETAYWQGPPAFLDFQ